ncbi:hypothetical protein [Streptomyces zhihengii]|uniref:hypothetical protein n=1 Tax=Streptomyces zhihengii TaxID=1818004 RepID=UPI0033A93447
MTNANDREMPLDRYLLNPEQYELLMTGYSQKIAQCMRNYGHSYPVVNFSAYSGMGAEAPRSRVDGRFGFQSMDHAKTWGYHPSGGIPKRVPSGADFGDPDFLFSLTGARDGGAAAGPGGSAAKGRLVPAGGCVGESLLYLTGSRQGQLGDSELAVRLKMETLLQGQRDPETVKVFSKWSHCMAERNYSYESPLDAMNDPQWGNGAKPSPKEISTAVADQECRYEHNVVGVWFAADFAHQRRAVAANHAELQIIKGRLDRQIAAAREIKDHAVMK